MESAGVKPDGGKGTHVFFHFSGGLKKPVFKAHGNSKSDTFKNAIRQTIDYINGNIGRGIEENLNLQETSA